MEELFEDKGIEEPLEKLDGSQAITEEDSGKDMATLTAISEELDVHSFMERQGDLESGNMVGDNYEMIKAQEKTKQRKMNRAKERSIMFQDEFDYSNPSLLQRVSDDMMKAGAGFNTVEWAKELSYESLIEKQLKASSQKDTETVARTQKLLDGLNRYTRVNQELEAAQGIADALWKDTSGLRVIFEGAGAMFQPMMEQAQFANLVDEATDGVSLSGYILTSRSVDKLRVAYSNSTPEQQIQIIRALVDGVKERRSQLGITENKSLNYSILQIALNTLREDAVDEASLTGIRNLSDVGLDLVNVFEIVGAAQLGKFGGRLLRKLFSAPVVTPRAKTNASSTFTNLVEADKINTGIPSTKVSPPSPVKETTSKADLLSIAGNKISRGEEKQLKTSLQQLKMKERS